MTIYIFNPEHDIALASNLEHFTAPHAGRELRHDLGFLPALWAKNDEYVLVDDIEAAKEGLKKLGISVNCHIIDTNGLSKLFNNLTKAITIKPWGWDPALRSSLLSIGMRSIFMPSNAKLNIIRQTSHRAWAAEHLLRPLRMIDNTVGLAEVITNEIDIRKFLSEHHNIVLKAPWSSSGRGIRYVSDMNDSNADTYYGITPQLEGWIRNIILRQGCVMAEPYYNKVIDFGMEFISNGKGLVTYQGLSLFNTVNGAYTGNVIDDEEHKLAMLSRYIPQSLFSSIRNKTVEVLSEAFNGVYSGPFGIDMMIVRTGNGLAVNPCVELNLRMTMGHVAILLNKKRLIEEKSMRITYTNGRYCLRIS